MKRIDWNKPSRAAYYINIVLICAILAELLTAASLVR